MKLSPNFESKEFGDFCVSMQREYNPVSEYTVAPVEDEDIVDSGDTPSGGAVPGENEGNE